MMCEQCGMKKAAETVNGYNLCRICFMQWLDRNEDDFQDYENLNKYNTKIDNPIVRAIKNLW